MKKRIVRKFLVLGIIFISITISIASVLASENKEAPSSQVTLKNDENILANITVEWESFFTNWKLMDLCPRVNITQDETRVFYFPEINGAIQMNFTVLCKHIMLNNALFPRFERYDAIIKHNNINIFNNYTKFYCCSKLSWEYVTLELDHMLNPVYTNGQNATLQVIVGTRTFPCGLLFGHYKTLENITVVPRNSTINDCGKMN
jgi:hypothetical protein